MRFLNFRKNKFIWWIVVFYILLFFILLSESNRSYEAYFYFTMSFILIRGGILGLKYKVDAFKKPPIFPVVNYKISYEGSDGIDGVMGRLGNVLAMIIGIFLLLASFST